jgi:hypothetical protein
MPGRKIGVSDRPRSCSAFARTMIAADPARGSSRETELSIKHPRQKR